MNFIPFLIAVFIGMISIFLIILPATHAERHFWNILRIRKFRRWVTKNKTKKWALRNGDQNIIGISRKNIIWHIILTFIFSFLMLRAQYTNDILQTLSHLLLIPTFAYFLGSIIQRQKIIIIKKERRLSSNAGT